MIDLTAYKTLEDIEYAKAIYRKYWNLIYVVPFVFTAMLIVTLGLGLAYAGKDSAWLFMLLPVLGAASASIACAVNGNEILESIIGRRLENAKHEAAVLARAISEDLE